MEECKVTELTLEETEESIDSLREELESLFKEMTGAYIMGLL